MISLKDIRKAADLIAPIILQTPLVHSPTLSREFGCEVHLKLENFQKTGSFKIRGAANMILSGLEAIGRQGVVAASAGNHAQGVALAARHAGVPSTIVMPEWASISKQEATRGYGGDVRLCGSSVEDSIAEAMRLADSGRVFIHPFDDHGIIAGQGTVALEIMDDLPDVDAIVVPVGGGGLISGVALAAKSIRPAVKIIGVQAEVCPSAAEALKASGPVPVAGETSIADGINVKQMGRIPYEIVRQYIDDLVLVSEEQIAAAILMFLERKKTLAEGAGAAPLAALIGGALGVLKNRKIVLLVSGGNVDSPLLGRIINQGLLRHGRIIRLRLSLSDRPGSLAGMLDRVAQLKANVLHIYHDRNVRNNPIDVTRVELELETRGGDHAREVQADLEAAGYRLERID
ncbi:MAG: threonine ammonia-lyase [Deltaproteobacteria bacterium]|nr:threonine ammonia-lyase [Deltaproteobacteria bacterium]